MPSLRQQARTVALQALYEADVSGHPATEAAGRLVAESRLNHSGRDLALHLVRTVVERRAEIDRLIQEAAPLWPLQQVAVVDRNVLRLATGELLAPPEDAVPWKATINEAVELAKRFGSDNSARFVNGVLGTISTRLLDAAGQKAAR